MSTPAAAKGDEKDFDSADYWIRTLDLVPHPGLETGFLSRHPFADDHRVPSAGGGDSRSAATNIYFLHQPGGTTQYPDQTYLSSRWIMTGL